ncbi:MAG: FAD-dependent oxidoreductase, partial [Actinomycetota bacterium]
VLHRGWVERVDSADSGMCVALADGTAILARRVVLATNPGVPQLPAWARDLAGEAPPGHIVHTEQLDVRGLPLHGQSVLLLGAGLTAGQLTLGALEHGAEVVLVARSNLRVGVFDVHGCWQGPPCLRGFHREPDAARRLRSLRSALPGGSMTPRVAEALRQAATTGRLDLFEGVTVHSARWAGNH